MKHLFSVIFMLTAVFHISTQFGSSISNILNLRCTFADTYLKDLFQIYDQYVISSKTVLFYFHAKDLEPEKISRVNDTYFVSGFDRSKPTRVIIHGFWNSYNSRINKAMRKSYMNHHDVNLIIVNYSRISRDTCYKIARRRVEAIGKKVAEFLDEFLGDDIWQWDNLVLVGHSLGSHTAGVTGRSVSKGRVGTIVALDPAGPGFETPDVASRLRKDDAEFIECIHSNGDNLGLFEPICDIDIYPNFGMKQPGCSIMTRDLCSHSRAWMYFADSLERNFIANECESIEEIRSQIPCNGTEIIMGGDDFENKRNSSGIFYLKTNEKPPFSNEHINL